MESISAVIVEQLLPVISLIVAGLLAKALNELAKWLKAKKLIESEDAFHAQAWGLATAAVKYAEEEAHRLSKNGTEVSGNTKLAIALQIFRNSLEKTGKKEDDLPHAMPTMIQIALRDAVPASRNENARS